MRPASHIVYVMRVGADSAATVQALMNSVAPAPTQPSRILLKPNWIKERHLTRDEYRQIITQPEVLRPVLDWVLRECPNSDIRLADGPEGSADMALLVERSGISTLLDSDRGASVTVEDLRGSRYVARGGVPIERISLPGDSMGATRVDLGCASEFFGHDGHRYYGADYDIDETNLHHQGQRQEYMFSGTALHSDLIVNLPKLKTHKKAGITASLKNLVGLNANKNWLPHHALGTPRGGGDAYPDDRMLRRLEGAVLGWIKPRARDSAAVTRLMRGLKIAGAGVLGDTQSVIRSGNWHGNDTIWRMILDLNRILLYARPDGSLSGTPERRAISLVDAIISGEGNGPEAPDAKETGIVVAGTSFAAVDLVCAKLMGFDWKRIPHLAHVFDPSPYPLADFDYADITVSSDRKEWNKPLHRIDLDACFAFRPHFGWAGHIEARR